jgi:hypothetical protein
MLSRRIEGGTVSNRLTYHPAYCSLPALFRSNHIGGDLSNLRDDEQPCMKCEALFILSSRNPLSRPRQLPGTCCGEYGKQAIKPVYTYSVQGQMHV